MDLLQSNANKALYEFTNSAKRQRDNWRDYTEKKWDEPGVHMSFRVTGSPVNLFLDVEQSLRMWMNMRDSLRNAIKDMSDEDKKILMHRIIHDEVMLGVAGRKSNVKEDLGL